MGGGVERNGIRTGSMVGAVAGLVFVLVNAGPLPGTTLLRGLGVLGFLVCLVAIVRSTATAPPPTPGALRVYGFCVLGEVIAIPVGANLLGRVLDEPDLVLCWVVLVVGVHFVPFATAFTAPLFRALGWALVAIALVGGVCVLAGVEDAQLWTALVAGFVLLGAAGQGVRRGRRTAQDRSRE